MRRPVQLSPAAVLLAGLIGGAALGLIGALMAIPIAAGGKVLLSERLRARDAVGTDAAAPSAGKTAPQSGQAAPHTPPAGPAQPVDRRHQPAAQDGDRRDDPTPS
jgi:hypothetical protein